MIIALVLAIAVALWSGTVLLLTRRRANALLGEVSFLTCVIIELRAIIAAEIKPARLERIMATQELERGLANKGERAVDYHKLRTLAVPSVPEQIEALADAGDSLPTPPGSPVTVTQSSCMPLGAPFFDGNGQPLKKDPPYQPIKKTDAPAESA